MIHEVNTKTTLSEFDLGGFGSYGSPSSIAHGAKGECGLFRLQHVSGVGQSHATLRVAIRVYKRLGEWGDPRAGHQVLTPLAEPPGW